eukprot:3736517-Pleurochrysis_carterae.AAC.2
MKPKKALERAGWEAGAGGGGAPASCSASGRHSTPPTAPGGHGKRKRVHYDGGIHTAALSLCTRLVRACGDRMRRFHVKITCAGYSTSSR